MYKEPDYLLLPQERKLYKWTISENLKKRQYQEICAEYIQKSSRRDLFAKIQTVEDYSKDYHTCTEEAAQEAKSQ